MWEIVVQLVKSVGPLAALNVFLVVGSGLVIWLLLNHILKQSDINAKERKEIANGFLNSLETTVKETTATNATFRDEIKSLGTSVKEAVASIEAVVSSMSRLYSLQSDCRETIEKIDVKVTRFEESLVRRPRRKVKNVKSPRGR